MPDFSEQSLLLLNHPKVNNLKRQTFPPALRAHAPKIHQSLRCVGLWREFPCNHFIKKSDIFSKHFEENFILTQSNQTNNLRTFLIQSEQSKMFPRMTLTSYCPTRSSPDSSLHI